jgi:hypothetical protein
MKKIGHNPLSVPLTQAPAEVLRGDDQATSIPDVAPIDAVKSSQDVLESSAKGTRGINLPMEVGILAVHYGQATYVSGPATLALDQQGQDETTQLRRQQLEKLGGGAQYVTQEAEYAAKGGGGAFFPAGPIGYGYATGEHGRTINVSSVRLAQGDESGEVLTVPADADGLLAMAPGESVTVTREGTTKISAGNMKCLVDEDLPDKSWVVASPIGVDLAIDHQGTTSTEVVRGDDSAACVTVSSQSEHSGTGVGGFEIGVYLGWAASAVYELGRRLAGGLPDCIRDGQHAHLAIAHHRGLRRGRQGCG